MPKDQNGVLSPLKAAIDELNLSKELASIVLAKDAFATVGTLLTMIRVRFLLFCHETFQAHTWPGLYGRRTGLRRARIFLR